MLAHFNANLKTVASTDVSEVELRAVLSQRHGNEERAVGFASRTITSAGAFSVGECQVVALKWAWQLKNYYSTSVGSPFGPISLH